MDTPPQLSFSLSRRWNIVLNLAVTIAAVLAILGLVNYFAARHFHR